MLLVTAVTLGGLLAGCGNGSPTAASSAPAAAAASFPATAGGVTLTQRPTHIVSLTPTGTEMLFQIGAGAQVTAVDDQSDFPTDAPKTDLSSYQPNAEAVAAHNPDLVVISDDSTKIKEQLTALRIPVYQMPAATTLDDTYGELAALGTLTGHPTGAAGVAKQIRDGVAKLVADVPKRSKPLTVYYELDQTYYSVTSATFIGRALRLLGLSSIADSAKGAAASGGYPQLSAEFILNADPGYVFLADTRCCKQSLATMARRPGWSTMSAVRSGRVVALDDDIASRWGPRLVDLLHTVADAIQEHPAP
jgi:iron complex transport system substrate-binding protein